MFAGLMESIEWFFHLVSMVAFEFIPFSDVCAQHDNNKDGFITKDEVIQLSESLLVSIDDIPALRQS